MQFHPSKCSQTIETLWDRASFQKVAGRLHSRPRRPNITGLESMTWPPSSRIKLAPRVRKSLISAQTMLKGVPVHSRRNHDTRDRVTISYVNHPTQRIVVCPQRRRVRRTRSWRLSRCVIVLTDARDRARRKQMRWRRAVYRFTDRVLQSSRTGPGYRAAARVGSACRRIYSCRVHKVFSGTYKTESASGPSPKQ